MTSANTRILTTHVGSLPRPAYLVPTLSAKTRGEFFDETVHEGLLRKSVDDVVRRQIQTGIDIVGDGEHSKTSFTQYTHLRLGGLAPSDRGVSGHRQRSRDALAFPEVYNIIAENAARLRQARNTPGSLSWQCAAPLSYTGKADLERDIAHLRSAIENKNVVAGFLTALSPTNIESQITNSFYSTHDEFMYALADAMRVEYLAIVDAGFYQQIDDPRLVTYYDRSPDISLADCRKFIEKRVEILNYALRGIPEEKVRFHTCYSVNVAPRIHDMPLKDYVDLMLKINAAQYSFEASNPRHEHEWTVWREIKLPEGKKLLPGVVSHCVYQVEHPELVAQRIARFAKAVGRENVIASNDCGFATAHDCDEVHPDVAWAKLAALTEGARLASAALWN